MLQDCILTEPVESSVCPALLVWKTTHRIPRRNTIICRHGSHWKLQPSHLMDSLGAQLLARPHARRKAHAELLTSIGIAISFGSRDISHIIDLNFRYGTSTKLQERFPMRRVSFGLAMISLTICSSAYAGDLPSAVSDGSQQVQKSSPTVRIGHPKHDKRASRTQSDGGALPLSSASAYAAEHSANLPISSVPRPASPPSNSWTGFYVGAGAGVGR
jgi:hypothetical protein